jgi:hypothetical protein
MAQVIGDLFSKPGAQTPEPQKQTNKQKPERKYHTFAYMQKPDLIIIIIIIYHCCKMGAKGGN